MQPYLTGLLIQLVYSQNSVLYAFAYCMFNYSLWIKVYSSTS